jgi:putative hydroxymethylpyrimidine transport system substrate-binding protein
VSRERRGAQASLRNAYPKGSSFRIRESYELFSEGRPELDDDLNRRAWADTLPHFALRPAAMDTARYVRFAAFLEQQGLIKTPPPVETYAVELER